MKKNTTKILIISLAVFFIYFFGTDFVQAFEYQMLEPLPGVGDKGVVSNFGVYLSNLYKLSISLAAVLAILQISFAGFKYLSAESFGQKTDAKEKITNSIKGLVLILISYLILNTINPDLVKTGFGIPTVTVTPYNPSFDFSNVRKTLSDEEREQILVDKDKARLVERDRLEKEKISNMTEAERKKYYQEKFQN